MFEGKEASSAEGSLDERIEAVGSQIEQFTRDATSDVLTRTEDEQARLLERLDQIVRDIEAVERDNPNEEDEFAAAEDHASMAAHLHTIRALAAEKNWEKACRGLAGYLDYVREKVGATESAEEASEPEEFRHAA